MSQQHRNIPSSEAHEPKGIESAPPNSRYVSDGSGSGNWVVEVYPDRLQDGWRDLIMPFTASEIGALNAPTFLKGVDDGSGSTGVWGYGFDKSIEEELFMNFHIDHDYKVGTNFYPHIHWSPTDTGTGVVRWGIEWTYAPRNPTTPEVFGNTIFTYLEQAAPGVAYSHMVAEVPDPGLELVGCEPDTIVWARVFRDATHANDTYNADAMGLSLDAHYQVDRYATPNKAPNFYI